MFKHNSAGIDPEAKKFPVYPKGEYAASITATEEQESSKGHDMVMCELTIIEHETLHGKTLSHWVVFIPAGEPGDGMSVHFRKCIGMPYGGDDDVDCTRWIGKKLRFVLDVDDKPYTNKKTGKTYTDPRNKITEIKPYGSDFPPVEKEEDAPF